MRREVQDSSVGATSRAIWASVMPAKLAATLGFADTVRSIPIVDPTVTYSVGLVVPQREPMTPLIAALVQTAREVAPTLEA